MSQSCFCSHTVQVKYSFLSLQLGIIALRVENNKIDQDIALSHLFPQGNSSVKRGEKGEGKFMDQNRKGG